jgi:hypothetical protein
MKIRLVGAELFHEDGRTDMTKLTVAFRNFVQKATKIPTFCNLAEARDFTFELPGVHPAFQ